MGVSSEQVAEDGKKFCRKCGMELNRDDIFCGYCGTRISKFGAANTGMPMETTGRQIEGMETPSEIVMWLTRVAEELEMELDQNFHKEEMFDGRCLCFVSEDNVVAICPPDCGKSLLEVTDGTYDELKRGKEWIGVPGGEWWINPEISEGVIRGLERLERLDIKNCRILMNTDSPAPAVISTSKYDIIIGPILWCPDFYYIRKGGLSFIFSTGWIENQDGEILGFYKEKIFSTSSLKEIKVYSNEDMREELFYITPIYVKGQGTSFIAVIDSHTNAYLGYFKNIKNGWEIYYNTSHQPIGMIYLARAGKHILELEGRHVAEINQKHKIWEINCTNLPIVEFDPRILLSCIIW